MAGLLADYGLISKWCLRGMIAGWTSLDTRGSPMVNFCCIHINASFLQGLCV